LVATLVTIASVVLGLPLAVLAVECWLSLLPIRRQRLSSAPAVSIRLAIIIPAHDEADCISEAVARVKEQAPAGSRIIVVADNCSDATAENARRAGAIVWERQEPTRRGKGYALNYAWTRLVDSPPDVVVCIDADCSPGANCIATIAQLAYDRRRPVQSAYAMYAPPNAIGLASVSALAVYVKNIVRPRGLQWLRLPCLLTGSGMAFPWEAIATVSHPEADIVEDMRGCTDLAIAGFAPLPCIEVGVSSPLPTQRSGFLSQRTRWEHGHLRTILTEFPRLLVMSVQKGSIQLLALALELAVPPLSLLAEITAVGTAALVAYGIIAGIWAPLIILLSTVAVAALGIALVWVRGGRKILPGRMIAAQVPRYLTVKAPLYLRFLSRPQRAWVRTERSRAIQATGEGMSATNASNVRAAGQAAADDASE
jgi:cellulose synthase/poly-beta-1,6-N-acetylglucosamine synthase-like glycosyltransferase